MSKLIDTYFITPPEKPTQSGPEGIRCDLNDGARVLLPRGRWHVRLMDADSGNILFSCDADNGWVRSYKRYFIRFHIQIFHRGSDTPLMDETLNLKNQPVLISFPTGTLGDLLEWFPYAERFQALHKCQLEYTMVQEVIELLALQYPQIQFSTPGNPHAITPYATYRVGLYFGGDTTSQPTDFRQVGFHRSAGYILGMDPRESPVRLNLLALRSINEPYVCIATQSTCQVKYWSDGIDWSEVVAHLRSPGYRALYVDLHAHYGQGFVWNHIPWGAEDFTGKIPLQERVNLLHRTSSSTGLSSGLSWLAWATHIPVVLISSFTLPVNEFCTPWRVFSSHGCNGYWDDTSLNFDHKDFLWCPRHKNTSERFECTRLATRKQANGVIDKLRASLAERSSISMNHSRWSNE